MIFFRVTHIYIYIHVDMVVNFWTINSSMAAWLGGIPEIDNSTYWATKDPEWNCRGVYLGGFFVYHRCNLEENHPRIRKCLGSPKFISHGKVRPWMEGVLPTTPGSYKNYDHHGYGTRYPSHERILQVDVHSLGNECQWLMPSSIPFLCRVKAQEVYAHKHAYVFSKNFRTYPRNITQTP